MTKITLFAAAAALAATMSTAAFAGSAISELQGATYVSIATVSGTSDNPLLSANGRVMERVDIDSLRARVSQNDNVRRQLESFGASIDDVIGITGSDSSNLTLYVRG